MNYTDFINLIIGNTQGIDAIINCLIARGFFIEKIDALYTLSDNGFLGDKEGAINDIQYLNEILKNVDLGYVSENKELIFSYNNPKQIIDLSSALFSAKGRENIPQEMSFANWNWHYVKNRLYGDKIPVCWLESYIALYVRALSACGLCTRSSCDGFHEQLKDAFILFDKPYSLWHQYLWEEYLSKKYNLPWDEKYEYLKINNDNRFNVYSTLHSVGLYLYNNRKALRNALHESCSTITKSICKKHTDIQILENIIMPQSKEKLDSIFNPDN